MQGEFERGMMEPEAIVGAFYQVVNWGHNAMHHNILGCYECWMYWLYYCSKMIYNWDHMLHHGPLGVDCCPGYGYQD